MIRVLQWNIVFIKGIWNPIKEDTLLCKTKKREIYRWLDFDVHRQRVGSWNRRSRFRRGRYKESLGYWIYFFRVCRNKRARGDRRSAKIPSSPFFSSSIFVSFSRIDTSKVLPVGWSTNGTLLACFFLFPPPRRGKNSSTFPIDSMKCSLLFFFFLFPFCSTASKISRERMTDWERKRERERE